eukprot:623622-Pyramimonas_sp.AAC.3
MEIERGRAKAMTVPHDHLKLEGGAPVDHVTLDDGYLFDFVQDFLLLDDDNNSYNNRLPDPTSQQAKNGWDGKSPAAA